MNGVHWRNSVGTRIMLVVHAGFENCILFKINKKVTPKVTKVYWSLWIFFFVFPPDNPIQKSDTTSVTSTTVITKTLPHKDTHQVPYLQITRVTVPIRWTLRAIRVILNYVHFQEPELWDVEINNSSINRNIWLFLVLFFEMCWFLACASFL